jgi:hypothetical protein
MLMTDRSHSRALIGENELRRQIDRSVSRALVDPEYAALLLNDPTVALADRGCSPQQFKSLRGIRAHTVGDFARQARALFWVGDSTPSAVEDLPLAAAAAR